MSRTIGLGEQPGTKLRDVVVTLRRVAPTRTWFVLGFGFLACLTLFSFSFDNNFRDDDYVFLAHAIESDSIANLLSPNPASFAFFRPGALLLFAAEFELFRFEGGRFLVLNFLLHLLNLALVVRIASALGMGRKVSILAAVLFGLGFGHYSRQLMWACTIGPIVAVTLSLTSLLCVIRMAQSLHPRGGGGRHRTTSFAIVVSSLGLAATMHESSLTLPIILVGAWWLLAARPVPGRNGYPILFMLPALAWWTILQVFSTEYRVYTELLESAPMAVQTMFRYPGFMLFPLQESQLAGAFRCHLILAAAILVACVMDFRRCGPGAKLVWVWLYAALLPYCLVELPGSWLQMRYTYHAAIPFCVLAARALIAVTASKRLAPRTIAVATAASVLIATLAFEFYLERQYDRYASNSENSARLRELQHRTTWQPARSAPPPTDLGAEQKP